MSVSPCPASHSLLCRNQSQLFQANVLQKCWLPEILDTFSFGQDRHVANAISNRPLARMQVHPHAHDCVMGRRPTLVQKCAELAQCLIEKSWLIISKRPIPPKPID